MSKRKRIGPVQKVTGANEQEVKVGFWDDGSVLITIPHQGAMAISQYFSGSENRWTNIRVIPLP